MCGETFNVVFTAQNMKFFIEDFPSKFGQIPSFLQICLHLPKKSLMENLIAVIVRGGGMKKNLTQLSLQ